MSTITWRKLWRVNPFANEATLVSSALLVNGAMRKRALTFEVRL